MSYPLDKIYYTKASFQLPITSFKILSSTPCINPDQIQAAEGQVSFFAEMYRPSICKEYWGDSATQTTDPRYDLVHLPNMTLTEWSL